MKGVNVEYGVSNRVIGEIDLFTYDKQVLSLFEVKSNPYNKELLYKAYNQLRRAVNNKVMTFHEFLDINPKRINLFYVTKKSKHDYSPTIKFLEGVNIYE